MKGCILLTVLTGLHAMAVSATLEELPLLPESEAVAGRDWLVYSIDRTAAAYRTPDGLGIALSNGLVRRTFRAIVRRNYPRSPRLGP